jgi:hypothetical protein
MKYLLIYLVPLLLFTACSDLVDDLNENPNSPTSSSYQYVLTGTEVGNMNVQTGEAARKAGIFAGQYTGIDRQHEGFSQYAVSTSDFDGHWNGVYVQVVANALETERAALDEGVEGVTKGITQVLRAMALGTGASLWGDIPFSEAGTPEVQNPSFESQKNVYEGLQILLDEAIANLQSGSGRPVAGSDIHFDGNPMAWQEVAQTLKARYYMHTKQYDQAFQAAQLGVSSPENSLLGPHGAALDDANLNHQFFAIQSRQSDLIVSEFMASLVDPDDATNPEFDNYRGNAKTDETGRYNYLFTVRDSVVQPNINGWAGQEEPSQMVTYAENLLILAEAGYRTNGFDEGLDRLNTYRQYLNSGGYMTTASQSDIQYDDYVAADFEAGGMENTDGLSAGDALLREILQERYITLFGQIEVFNDTRRTEGEQNVRVPVEPNVGDRLPQRFLYPTTEIDRNNNVPDPIPNFFDPTPVNQ